MKKIVPFADFVKSYFGTHVNAHDINKLINSKPWYTPDARNRCIPPMLSRLVSDVPWNAWNALRTNTASCVWQFGGKLFLTMQAFPIIVFTNLHKTHKTRYYLRIITTNCGTKVSEFTVVQMIYLERLAVDVAIFVRLNFIANKRNRQADFTACLFFLFV